MDGGQTDEGSLESNATWDWEPYYRTLNKMEKKKKTTKDDEVNHS